MKKTRFLAILLAVVCLVLPLASCSHASEIPTLTMGEIFDFSYTTPDTPVITKHEMLPKLNQYNCELKPVSSNISDELLCLESQPKNTDFEDGETKLVIVFNLKTNEIIKEFEYTPVIYHRNDDDIITSMTTTTYAVDFRAYDMKENGINEDSFFTLTITTREQFESRDFQQTSVTLYGNDGIALQSCNKDVHVRTFENGFFQFENTLYQEVEGRLEKFLDIPTYNTVPYFEIYANHHFYDFDGESGINVYDEQMNLVYHWFYQESDTDVNLFVLNNGWILAQAITQQPDHVDVYDYIQDTKKYTVQQWILDPFESKVEALDVSFVIMSCVSKVEVRDNYPILQGVHPDIENVAFVCFIQDSRINLADAAYVTLTNDVTIESIINPLPINTPNQDFIPLGNGYLVATALSQTYIFDASGEQIATFTKDLDFARNFIIDYEEGIFYDYHLNELYRCDQHTTIHTSTEDYVILCEKTDLTESTYFYFDGVSPIKKLFTHVENQHVEGDTIHVTSYQIRDGYYFKAVQSFKDGELTTSCSYYTFDGDIICVTDSILNFVYNCDSAILFVDDEGKFQRFFASNP